ncbi:MAG: TolC family protein [Alphaproteobacteria bacterium]
MLGLAAIARRFGPCLIIGAALAVSIGPVSAQTTATAERSPGSTVDELLVLARQLNPELAARALESDAASAKVSAAGSLEDPMLRVTSDEVDRTSGPRINKMIYWVEQEIPLWGKLDLKRRIAEAEAAGVRGRERAATLELEARVKTAFVQYYRASRSIEITHDLHALLRTVSQAAQARYAQGQGNQADAIRAEVERSRLDLDVVALERARRTAQGRLNALLARPPGSSLAAPSALQPLPSDGELGVTALLARARQENPAFATASAEITAAEEERRLIDKSWYPNVTLGAAGITRANGPPGYMASIGLKVPLQWGVREAQAREAVAKQGAAKSKLETAVLEVQAGLEEAAAGLEAARRMETLLATGLRPQTEAGYRSALAAYQNGRGDLTAVLEAANRLQEVQLEILKVQAEQRLLIADIERAVGGEL